MDAGPHKSSACQFQSASTRAAIEVGTQVLQVLFSESDTVLFRPVETWSEGGKKTSKADFRSTCYRKATSISLTVTLRELQVKSVETRCNLFFGVCPRFGGQGHYDLAWQIRKVPALWVDLDHIKSSDADARISSAGLPTPSISVSSGHGMHFYWLLDEPFLIDDIGDPPAVETEWVPRAGEKSKAVKYVTVNDQRRRLDELPELQCLSAKAQLIQRAIVAIAKACGGDHTSDLSRLLRIPGSLNRKDERNGQLPVLCELIECDPARRFGLSDFRKFETAATMAPHPKARLSAKTPVPNRELARASQLANLIAKCAHSQPGARSEADFAVCCFACQHGIDKETLWENVADVGKFQEQGRRYFDLTWTNAADQVQRGPGTTTRGNLETLRDEAIHGEQSGNRPVQHESPPLVTADDADERARPTLIIKSAKLSVAEVLEKITRLLKASGCCFERSDQLVAIHNRDVHPILTAAELAALLNQYAEFYVVQGKVGEFRPLPTPYGLTWLNHLQQRQQLPSLKLFTHNPVYTPYWHLTAPGFDPQSGIYYSGEEIRPRSGTQHLDMLLQDFCFKSPADRTNYLAVMVTVVLIAHFVGSKPAVLFNGNQPELGKSILAQIIAILRDGQPTETVSYNPNDEEFEKRLGALVRRGFTTVIVDNAKCRGRSPRIESPCLERCITDAVLSFRFLGHSDSIRAENSHIFCITANSADVSRDLVTRSIVVNLYYEGDPARRAFSIADPEGFAQQHRTELLGELLGMIERWKVSGRPLESVATRFNKRGWGNIVGGVLRACGEPDFLSNAGEAATMLDETRREFGDLVSLMAASPKGNWNATELVELSRRNGVLAGDLGDGSPRSLVTKMGTIASRFDSVSFPIESGSATFKKSDERKGSLYRVTIEPTAEP